MDKKFEKIYDVDDYEVFTDNGWKDIEKVCKTIPYNVYEVKLEDGKFIKAADDHIVFSENKNFFVKNLKISQKVDTVDGNSKILSIENKNVKENMYDLQVEGKRYYSNGILSHNTTVVGVFALWYAIFHPDKNIGIVSNKEASSKMILSRIKRMYESLPPWLKPGVTEYSKTFTTFDNGTRILISATSPDAFRGESLNLLISDELAFVPKHQAEEFWAANYPTISASKTAKIIVISTPQGMFNIFHKIYSQAERGENTFFPKKITWSRVPGRDDEWAQEQLKNLGPQKFAQEFSCVSGDTIITTEDTSDGNIYQLTIEEFFEDLL